MKNVPMKKIIPWLMVVSICSIISIAVIADQPGKNRRSSGKKSSGASADVDTTKITDRIDELVDAKLDELKQKRNPLIDDEVFVRRIYLDAVGRIPTLEETQTFLNYNSKNKREQLIDSLLDSYGHVSRQFNYWADVLRVLSRNDRVHGETYINFLKDSLEQNQPYDEFVRALLTSEGYMLEEDKGAVGYYLRDLDMPEDNMSNTVRVFLGTRLECAQCHDHPFDVWTQRDYFEMVAFTGGMEYQKRRAIEQFERFKSGEFNTFRKQSPEEFARARRMLRLIDTGVFGNGTGLAKLPEGYAGSDGEEHDIIAGKTMFDRQTLVDAKIPKTNQSKKRRKRKKQSQQLIPGAKDLNSRAAYADWLTSDDNPRFSITIANRLWKQAMGLGLIEPVDSIDDSTRASNEPLMDYLAEVIVDLNFDRRAFLKAIYNSRTYQSHCNQQDIDDKSTYAFNGPLLRRMSAEQLWDSLMALTLPNIDQRTDTAYSPRDEKRVEIISAVAKKDTISVDDLKMLAETGGSKFRQEMKAEIANEVRGVRQQMGGKVKMLNQQISLARRKGQMELVKDLMLQRSSLVTELKSNSKFNKLKRASELTSPAPAGHFLREFGQSDREQIENANTDPAVTQVLSMMNGFIEKQISQDENTVLMSNVLNTDRRYVIDVIYLTMLSRRPSGKEVRMWVPDFNQSPFEAYNDLIWMLANSNEFIFVR